MGEEKNKTFNFYNSYSSYSITLHALQHLPPLPHPLQHLKSTKEEIYWLIHSFYPSLTRHAFQVFTSID